VQAHEADLRVEVEHEQRRRAAASELPHAASAAAPSAAQATAQDGVPADAASFAADIAAQGSEAAHDDRLRALLQYAERLTLQPGSVEPAHIDALRAAGLDDRAIHDAAQAVAYFAYINRVADGLGVDLEPEPG
jgi:uncharacterized peroxidase-related enzyme